MRRLILLLIVLSVVLPLQASHIVSDGTLPDDVLAALAGAVGKETYGRGDLSITASSYAEEELDDGAIHASILLSYEEKEVLLEFFGTGRSELLSSLGDEVHNLLFYEKALYSSSPLILDYVLDGSYSFLSEDRLRHGTRLKAVDSLGNVRGLFEVGESFSEADVLDPVYIDDPYPGMALSDAGEWKVVSTLSTGFDFSSPEMAAIVSAGRTDLIYPFVPIVSLAARYGEGGVNLYAGIGIEAYMNFSRIFPSVDFTLIQEGRIGGSASVLLGGGSNGFDWCSVFSVFYEHRATPSFFWRLGYQNLQGEHMLVLGLGGDF